MKYITLYTALIITIFHQAININAQLWFDVGLNNSLGTGIWSDFKIYEETQIDVIPKMSSNHSLKIGLNLNESESFVVDIGYLNRNFQLQQKNIGNSNNPVERMSFGYSGLRILPLYRHTNEETYFEIGPEFGWIHKSYFTDEANGTLPENTLFEEYNIRGAIGFGAYLLGNERISLVTGMRVLYDFKDLRSETARKEGFPYQNYENQRESFFRAIDIQLCLELNISLGFLVRSTCGRRKLLISW